MLVVVTFRLALRAIDFLFVLHMKNVTGSLFSGTNSKEMIALIKAYSSKKPGKSGGTEHASELDDAEAGRAGKAGCFGKRREYVYKESESHVFADVRLDPAQERAFEERAAWLVKIRAELEAERRALRHEIEHATHAQTQRRRDARGGATAQKGAGNQSDALSILKTTPKAEAPDPVPGSPARQVPGSPAPSQMDKKDQAIGFLKQSAPVSPTKAAAAAAPSAPSSPATPAKAKVEAKDWRDQADLERLETAKLLEKRTNQLHADQAALAKEVIQARKARYEADQRAWAEKKREENARLESLSSDPNAAMLLSTESTKKLSSSETTVEERMAASRRSDGDFDGFFDANVVLIMRRFAKGVVAYLFLAWFLRVWNADFTIFVAFSAVGALFVLFSLREAALNVIGACVIVFYKAFVVGDWIKIESERTGGTPREGVVRDISFFFVSLTRVDDLTVMRVPNMVFLRRAVINVSRQHVFRHDFVLPVTLPKSAKGMDGARAFMNEAKRRVEATRDVRNAWVTLDPDPVGGGGAERRVRVRFDFEHGPQSPRNLNDPNPLSIAGVECRAWRAWLNFLVARDDAMAAAIDAAEGKGVLLGQEGPGGAGGAIRGLDASPPVSGTNEGGNDAQFLATRKHERVSAREALASAEVAMEKASTALAGKPAAGKPGGGKEGGSARMEKQKAPAPPSPAPRSPPPPPKPAPP